MQHFKVDPEGREKISLIVVVVILLVLTGGLVKLQILDHVELARRSENNRIRVVPIVPRRGVVRDCERRIIIDNRPSYTVSVVPAEMSPEATLPNLSRFLQLDTLGMRERINKNVANRYLPVPVKRDVSDTAVAILEEQSRRFPGVELWREQVREYQKGLVAESFTGYVVEASWEDLVEEEWTGFRLFGIDYRLLGGLVGREGIEKQYDRVLRGHEGTAYKEVSAAGREDTTSKQVVPRRYDLSYYERKEPDSAVSGADLILTIDIDLQQACANALDTFCCGAVVAVDPRNGEVLAMASYPGYDPNMFSSEVPESLWQAISSDSTHPLLNRPLNGLYPPGSTVKLVTVGAALEEGIINENSILKPCTGGFRFGNRVFHCWERGGHGCLTAAHALEQSCDVFMYQLGLTLGVDGLARYFSECGFGDSTDIDLPSESRGKVPNSQYYDTLYGENKWTRALALNIAIGQGELLVTPLQLAQFFCGLANNGKVYRPHIVKLISYPNGEEITVPPEVSFTLPFSPATLRILKEGIRLVVEGEHGTARSLKNETYSIGGKTGTAENPHGDDHSWFVGVAPLQVPEIVVCAIVENAGHGSEVAAPVVGKIIERYMQKKSERAKIALTSSKETE